MPMELKMHRNPWFTLILGLMVGLVLGYVLAERQPVPPAKAMARPASQGPQAGLPEGHPPVEGPGAATPEQQQLAQQAAELQQMLAQSPGDSRLMVALGNLYFDAGRWQEARMWYERSLEGAADDPNVITDLAVVYRNLEQQQRALELLDRAIEIRADHWQAWYNKVIVLHFDLHEHDRAAEALKRLKAIAASDPSVPDLSSLEAEVLGS
jgi:tetratricopeptide (TPR) repeat protein